MWLKRTICHGIHLGSPVNDRMNSNVELDCDQRGWRAGTRDSRQKTSWWDCTHHPLHRDQEKAGKDRRSSVKAAHGVDLTSPGTEYGVRGMGRVMMRMCGFRRRHEEAACCAQRKCRVEQDHPNCNDGKPALHFMPSRTCRTRATDSSLSQARGPTARPIARPSRVRSTVVGKPRTMKDRETSSRSSNRTGRSIPRC